MTRNVAAIILAAGRGARAGQAHGPKQYRSISGKSILRRSVEAFLGHPHIDEVVVVIHPEDHDRCEAALGVLFGKLKVVTGGATRQASTLNALEALAADPPDLVLIHDAARSFIETPLIDRVIEAAEATGAAVPALPVADTLKRCDEAGLVLETVPRADLHAAQTPQGFQFAAILDAHRSAARALEEFTDDAAIAAWAGLPIKIVEGDSGNTKITWERDIAMADKRLSGAFPDVRTGNGYDVHALEAGDAVVLCGVRIPHDRRLSGHSDADVGLHALTDALLATCSAGDIGTHFPPSDPQWRGAASRIFLEHAAEIVRSHGGRITHADVTLVCEAPKIGPHRVAMVNAMADILGIETGRVSVKATTNEGLGFIGRSEGIAAIATATVVYLEDPK